MAKPADESLETAEGEVAEEESCGGDDEGRGGGPPRAHPEASDRQILATRNREGKRRGKGKGRRRRRKEKLWVLLRGGSYLTKFSSGTILRAQHRIKSTSVWALIRLHVRT